MDSDSKSPPRKKRKISLQDGSTHSRESLKQQRVAKRQDRRIEAYVVHSIQQLDHVTLQHQKKVSTDLNLFRSRDIDKLPFLHLFLKHVDLAPENISAVLRYINKITSHVNSYFSRPGDFIDCTLKSASGKKAGEQFPEKASVVLCAACEQGDENVIAAMLAAGSDVNQCDPNGLSPLMLASRAGCHDNVIDLLVRHGARLDQSDVNEKNSLMLACENEHWHTAITLHKHITEANMSYQHCFQIEQAYLTAIQLHGVEFVESVAQDANAQEILLNKLTLTDVINHGYGEEIVKYFLEHQSPSEEMISEAATIACKNDSVDALKVLLPHVSNEMKSSLIETAFHHHHFKAMEVMLERCKGENLPSPNISLHEACYKNQVGLVRFLLANHEMTDELDKPKGSYDPPLICACKMGHKDTVRCLLQCGANIDVLSDETPLTAACKHGRKELVEYLLDNAQEPDINQPNIRGQTPLQVGVEYKHESIAKHLIQMGADLSIGNTVIAAYQSQQYDVVRCLVEHGASYQSLFEITTLSELCKINDSRLVEEFTKINPNITDQEYSAAFEVSVSVGNVSMLRQLLNADFAPLTADIVGPALRRACDADFYESLSCLLDYCSKVMQSFQHASSDSCQHPVCRAMQNPNVSATRELLRADASRPPRTCLEHSLRCACEAGSAAMVDIILGMDSDVVRSSLHGSGGSCPHPLCTAIRKSHVNVIDTLLQNGASLSVSKTVSKDNSGHTREYHDLCHCGLKELCTQKIFSVMFPKLLPKHVTQGSISYGLSLSCKYANTTAVRLLLTTLSDTEKAAVVNDDRHGMIPLHAAIRRQSSELVKMLVNAGADPNKTYNKETPLYVACYLENFELLSMVITAMTNRIKPDEAETKDYQSSNPNLQSPLVLACERNYIDIVEELLENEADPDEWAAGSQDETSTDQSTSQEHILMKAHRDNHHEVVRLLLEYGADPKRLEVDLKTACELGYAERARYLVQQPTTSNTRDLLEQCVEAARNGFPETALEIMIETDDIQLQMQSDLQDMLGDTMHKVQSRETITRDIERDESDGQSTLPLLWEYFNKGDIDKVRKLIKEGQEVNIPNAAGRSLLQECIQRQVRSLIRDICESPRLGINQQDIYGRTALFDALHCVDLGNISVFDQLLSMGADINARDHLGRSVLHEWQVTSDGIKCGPPLENLVENVDVNVVDHKKQTALHIAILEENTEKVKQLLSHGSDRSAKDINHMTPLDLAKDKPRVLQALDAGEQQADRCGASMEDRDSQKAINMSNRLVPYIHNAYFKCRSFSPESVFDHYSDRVYYTWEQEENTKQESAIKQQTQGSEIKSSINQEIKTFTDTIVNMLNDISECVRREDPLLSFTPVLSGSCAEGTKVIAMDEADILCIFNHELWRDITLSTVTSAEGTQVNQSFVQIASTSSDNHPDLFTDGTLSKAKLLKKFYHLIKKHLPVALKKYNRLNVIDIQNAMTNLHSLACFNMVWHGTELPCQKFSFDVVPAIPVTQEQLPDTTRQALKHSDIIHNLYVVPKTGTFDASQYDPAFRVSFSSTECHLFHAMPAALKQGYMLTKVLKHDCFVMDSIESGVCSYNLKTATFECMESEFPDWKEMIESARCKQGEISEHRADPEAVMGYACKILDHLQKALMARKQMSFFLKDCDLIMHSIDKNDERQLMYILYCKALVSDADDEAWKELATYIAKFLIIPKYLHHYLEQDVPALQSMGLDDVSINSLKEAKKTVEKPDPVSTVSEETRSLAGTDTGTGNSDAPSPQSSHDILDENVEVNIEMKTSVHLQFKASWKVGMNTEGDIILAEDKGTHLYRYTWSGGEFSESWSRMRPSDVTSKCRKAVTSFGQTLLQDDYNPTLLLSQDEERRQQNRGKLLDCLHDSPVYAQEEDGKIELVIAQPEEEKRLILRFNSVLKNLSVCGVGDKMAVVDGKHKTLSIFTGNDLKHEEQLEHTPWRWNAVCCSGSHIFVIGRSGKSIHVHTWDGICRKSWSHQELGLHKMDGIYGIQYHRRDGMLLLAVGKHDVQSLYALQIHYNHKQASDK